MAEQGKFKRKLGLLDLTFLGCGSIIGSGWLYGAMNAAGLAGSLAWLPWILGAIIFIAVGLVYAELTAALPRAGGFLRFPEYSHGSVVGFLMGFAALLGYTSVIAVEVVAVRQYATFYLPELTTASGGPTAIGFILQSGLVVLFFLINYWSVNFFGKTNTLITIFKFVVPILIIVMLFANADFSGFSAGGAEPGGLHGAFKAVVAAGIAFAFTGFRQAVDFAAEARNPQKDVPRAIILAVVVCLVIYLLLQFAYLAAVPADMLANGGWANISWDSPWANLAETLGIIWLANLVLIDSAISPAAAGNIFFSGTARMLFAWAKNGYFYSVFYKMDQRTGLPRGALWLALVMGIMWTIPQQFQEWSGIVSAATAALVLTFMTGPVAAAVFRKKVPDMERPYRVGGMRFLAPFAFVVSTLVAYWSGWEVIKLLIMMIVASLVVFFAFADKDAALRKHLREDLSAAAWLFGFYIFLLIMCYVGSFGPGKYIAGPWDSIIVAIGSLGIYYWAVNTALAEPRITVDEELDLDSPVD